MESTIIEKIRKLSPELQNEVVHYIDFLQREKKVKSQKIPNLNWIGGLRAYRDQFTALELQKKALEWRD